MNGCDQVELDVPPVAAAAAPAAAEAAAAAEPSVCLPQDNFHEKPAASQAASGAAKTHESKVPLLNRTKGGGHDANPSGVIPSRRAPHESTR